MKTFTVFKLIMVIKNKLKINQTEAIYLFAGNTLLHAEQTLEDVYEKYVSEDKFLHLGYCEYPTFGNI
ncbi:MAG: hypothetical protein KDD45_16975 [Bdellovibrionales bacterium]|nr:hypothetical protein [Bdellovibrionales bacterium]